MHAKRLAVIGALCVMLLGAVATAQSERTFKVGQEVHRGRVIAVDDVTVTVRYEDRGEMREKSMGHGNARVVPGSGTISITPSKGRAGGASKAAPAPTSFAVKPVRGHARRLEPSAKVQWTYEPVDARPETRQGAYALELGYGSNVFTRPDRVAEIAGRSSAPGLLVSGSVGGVGSGGIKLQRLGFEDGGGPASAGVFEGPGNRRLLSAGRDGAFVALTEGLGSDQFVEFHRIDVEGGALAPQLRVEPKTARPTARRPWATMVRFTHALTEMGGALELWDVETGGLLLSIESPRSDVSFVDAARAHVFVPQDGWTAIVDLRSGRAVGRLDQVFTSRDRVAVRPDGKRMAWLENRSIVLMDLVEGASPWNRLGLPQGVRGQMMEWLDGERVLIDGELIYDVGRGTAIGRLETGLKTSVSCAYGMVWLSSKGPSMRSNHVLTGRSVDTPKRRASNVLERGDVAVHVRAGDAKLDKRLRKQFTKRLERAGVEVDEDGDVRLAIGAERAVSEQRTYHSTVDGTKQTKTVNKIRWSVAIEHGDRTYWRTGGVWDDLPMVVAVREGQSIEEAARGKQRPLEDVILDVRIPTFVGDQRLDDIAVIEMPAIKPAPTVTAGAGPGE